MTGILIKQGNLDTDNIQGECHVNVNAIYKPKWNRSFPQSPQREPTLLTPWSWTPSFQNYVYTQTSLV